MCVYLYSAPITATNDPKPWMVYVNAAKKETIVLCGVVNKPNPMGKQMVRELILTSHKRLIYVDATSLELKGTVDWKNETGVEPFVKLVNLQSFVYVLKCALCFLFLIFSFFGGFSGE